MFPAFYSNETSTRQHPTLQAKVSMIKCIKLMKNFLKEIVKNICLQRKTVLERSNCQFYKVVTCSHQPSLINQNIQCLGVWSLVSLENIFLKTESTQLSKFVSI